MKVLVKEGHAATLAARKYRQVNKGFLLTFERRKAYPK
jgi:hypothetical protein